MLTRPRYTVKDVILWTRFEILGFLAYAGVVAVLYVVAGCHALQLPWAPLAVVGTAVAFIVGFQNNAAYGRIWEARKIWGGIVNTSRTFGMRVVDCVVDESGEGAASESELQSERRTLIHRHIAWMGALRHAMREPRSWEVNELAKTNREWFAELPERVNTLRETLTPLLPADELERVLSKSNKQTAILFEQSRHLRELKERGRLWEFAFLELQQTIETLFDHQGKSERIKNFPYPRQYATLSFYFVRLFVILIPFATIPEFWEVGLELDAQLPGAGRYFVWLAVPFAALISWIFHVMERIGRVGENPFEGTPNDIPISSISRGIEIDLRQLLGEPESAMPAALPEHRGVQI